MHHCILKDRGHSDRAQDAGINLQHLKLTECEAESMEKEKVADSYPGFLGADALPKAPTLPAQENDPIVPQLYDNYIKGLLEE